MTCTLGSLCQQLAVFALVSIFACVSTRSVYDIGEKRISSCSKNMACRWAICPWTRKPSGFFPDADNCLVINNEGCRCPPEHICTLTDLMEPGRAQLKYSYRCIAPELTREIYQLGKRTVLPLSEEQ